jgi:hypothetical protein
LPQLLVRSAATISYSRPSDLEPASARNQLDQNESHCRSTTLPNSRATFVLQRRPAIVWTQAINLILVVLITRTRTQNNSETRLVAAIGPSRPTTNNFCMQSIPMSLNPSPFLHQRSMGGDYTPVDVTALRLDGRSDIRLDQVPFL